MKIKRLIVSATALAGVTVTALIIISCQKKQSYNFETSAAAKGSVTNIVSATGTLEAITSVEVGTQVSGIVEKLYVDFNSSVKKGQILAELDKTALKSSVDQALASLENAKAEKAYQEATFKRTKALFDKSLVAEADYDLARYNYEKSMSSLKTSQASYDKAMVNLGYATIYSPIDGVVMNRAVDEGQTVAASFNTPVIFTIAQDLTQMQVEADIDESDIGMVKDGQRVEFTVDAFPDETFNGTVMQIRLDPTTTSSVVTYTVVINAPNPEMKLLPGLTATINIYVEEVNNVLTIPAKALKFTPGAGYLASLDKDIQKKGIPSAGGQRPSAMAQRQQSAVGQGSMPEGVAQDISGGMKKPTMVWIKNGTSIHPAPVSLGINNGTTAEVKSGLREGDEVVTGMSAVTGKAKEKSTTAASSPFMPKRPGSDTKATGKTTANK